MGELLGLVAVGSPLFVQRGEVRLRHLVPCQGGFHVLPDGFLFPGGRLCLHLDRHDALVALPFQMRLVLADDRLLRLGFLTSPRNGTCLVVLNCVLRILGSIASNAAVDETLVNGVVNLLLFFLFIHYRQFSQFFILVFNSNYFLLVFFNLHQNGFFFLFDHSEQVLSVLFHRLLLPLQSLRKPLLLPVRVSLQMLQKVLFFLVELLQFIFSVLPLLLETLGKLILQVLGKLGQFLLLLLGDSVQPLRHLLLRFLLQRYESLRLLLINEGLLDISG